MGILANRCGNLFLVGVGMDGLRDGMCGHLRESSPVAYFGRRSRCLPGCDSIALPTSVLLLLLLLQPKTCSTIEESPSTMFITVKDSLKSLAKSANFSFQRRLPGLVLSLPPMPLALAHTRHTCTKAGCTIDPSDSGTAAAQMWALVMNNWNAERADWKAERQRFDADREQFHRHDTWQAIRIAEMKVRCPPPAPTSPVC